MKMTKNRNPAFVRFFAVLTLTVATAAASGAETPATLRLATITNLPPYSFEENGALRGIDVDTVREIAKRAGIAVEIETMPWARVLQAVERGAVDGSFSMYYVPARESFLVYEGVMHYDSLGLIALAARPISYRDEGSLFGLAVARGRGVFVTEAFEKAAAERKITVFDSDDTQMGNVRMLLVGRVDAVIGVQETMLYFAGQLGASEKIIAVSEPIDRNREGYLALSKASPAASNTALRARLQAALKSVMTDGTYDAIRAKYNAPARR